MQDVAVLGDVTEAAQVNAAVSAARAAFGGRIDILHNTVGITSMGGPVEESRPTRVGRDAVRPPASSMPAHWA